ncbi:GspH/FimT family pseudopilin [Ectothiorhodospira sp. 9905]|uniref:GspH/FimT family pseudopilin n=1 Tax=unclassified Ectothiorhodospira TaxID=2684909 RepID=UPI00351D207C
MAVRSAQVSVSGATPQFSIRAKGFTLVELMTTVAVLLITITVAVPSFRSIIQNTRSTALVNELSSAMNLGRSEAIKRGREARVCPRNNAGSACSGDNDWTVGWLVQSEGNVVRVWDAPPAGAVIVAPANPADGIIRFNGLGGTEDAGVWESRFVGCSGEQSRQMNIGATGRISVRRVDCP